MQVWTDSSILLQKDKMLRYLAKHNLSLQILTTAAIFHPTWSAGYKCIACTAAWRRRFCHSWHESEYAYIFNSPTVFDSVDLATLSWVKVSYCTPFNSLNYRSEYTVICEWPHLHIYFVCRKGIRLLCFLVRLARKVTSSALNVWLFGFALKPNLLPSIVCSTRVLESCSDEHPGPSRLSGISISHINYTLASLTVVGI